MSAAGTCGTEFFERRPKRLSTKRRLDLLRPRSYAINEVAHRVAVASENKGVAALHPAAGFPMEMDQFSGRIWVVSHKPVAVAAGLGQVGTHRSVIHPVFDSFINLATVLVAAEVTTETTPIDYNPCLSCKLCVTACPVGAIEPDGYFNFSACLTHNYREFMGGFTDWVEGIAYAKNGLAVRETFTESQVLPLTPGDI